MVQEYKQQKDYKDFNSPTSHFHFIDISMMNSNSTGPNRRKKGKSNQTGDKDMDADALTAYDQRRFKEKILS